MKNKRLYVLKEAVVNEVQLSDLYSQASKVEQSVIALAEMGVKFSNPDVKRKVLALKTQASEFTTLLSNILTNEGEEDNTNDLEVVAAKANIEDKPAPEPREDVMGESVATLAEAEAKRYNMIVESIMEADDDIEMEVEEDETKEDVPAEDTTDENQEGEMTLDFSNIFADLVANTSDEGIIPIKDKIITVLKDLQVEGIDTVITSFESVIDADSLNSALTDLYNFADANGILINI